MTSDDQGRTGVYLSIFS